MKKILLCATFALAVLNNFAQNCSEIFISEYVEGDENNKAIELYNPTSDTILLDGRYSMGRDRDGAGNPMLMNITGKIAPYDVLVFALDKTDPLGTGNEVPLAEQLLAAADTFLNPVYDYAGPNSGQSYSPMYFNGDDAFVLVKNGVTILDIVGRIGEDPGWGWAVPNDPGATWNSANNPIWWTRDNTLIRKPSVKQGILSNPAVFNPSTEWDSLPSNTFSNLGQHLCDCNVTGIENKRTGQFSIFPNPVNQAEFTIRATDRINQITMFSSDGRLLMSKEEINQSVLNIEMPDADAGIYHILIEFSDGSHSVQKLIYR
jgi:hypothetical protein